MSSQSLIDVESPKPIILHMILNNIVQTSLFSIYITRKS